MHRIIAIVGIMGIVAIAAVAPAEAVVFTINGGVVENGGINTPCAPCTPAGATGIPVGTQGYVAANSPLGAGEPVAMNLSATPGTIVFHYLGSDATLHNQFLVDLDHNGTFTASDLVFDNQRASNPEVPYSHPGGLIAFEYIFNVGGTNTAVANGASTFNIFDACVPNAGNPRTCSQGFIGLADGLVGLANDDHQDLGVQFRTPEPGTLSLLGAGLLGLGLVTFRRRKA